MTGSNKNKKQKDDTIGPRIRHPSGHVYLGMLYLKEKTDKTKLSGAAKLYQNIIEYSLANDRPIQHEFIITDIGYWLLKHNEDYKNYYRGSDANKTTDANKLDGISKRVKRYLHNLEQWGLLEKVGETHSRSKNGQKTPLYSFTYVGYLIAWVLEYDYKPHRRKIAKRAIFDLIELVLIENFYSYMTDFLARIYAKCMQKDLEVTPFIPENAIGIFDRIIISLIYVVSNGNFQFPKAIEYFSKSLHIVMTDKKSCDIFLGLYFEALEELSEDIRKKIIAHEKAEIESRFVVSQPSKDWEEIWLNNINNRDALVLYAVCQNKECSKRYYPAVVQYYYYKKNLKSSSTDYNYLIEDCKYCSTKNSLYVFDSYEVARLNMN